MITLGDVEAQGRPILIWCNRCGYKRERDSLTLCLLLGRDRPAYGLWTALRCSECGASGKRKGDVYAMAEPAPYIPASER